MDSDKPKYPQIEVPGIVNGSNAYAILGRVKKALKRAGISNDEVDEFWREAVSSDYDHLLATCRRWVTVL